MLDFYGKEIRVELKLLEDAFKRAADLKPPYDEVIGLSCHAEYVQSTRRIRKTSYEATIVSGARLPVTFAKYLDIFTRRFAPRDRLPPTSPSDSMWIALDDAVDEITRGSAPRDRLPPAGPSDTKVIRSETTDAARRVYVGRTVNRNDPSMRYTEGADWKSGTPFQHDEAEIIAPQGLPRGLAQREREVAARGEPFTPHYTEDDLADFAEHPHSDPIVSMAEAIRKGNMALYHEVCEARSVEEAQEIIRRTRLTAAESPDWRSWVALRATGGAISLHGIEREELALALKVALDATPDGEAVQLDPKIIGKLIETLEAPNLSTIPFNGFAGESHA